MKPKASFALTLLPLLCILLFTGCAGTVGESSTPSEGVSSSAQPAPSLSPEETETDSRTVTLSAQFRREDGTTLDQQSVRLSDGKNSMDYPLDEEGQLRIAGLPKTGSCTVSVVENGGEAGTMTLDFSIGSVIDAATDADGVGHVTLKGDTDTVCLDFILDKDGTLSCSLRLPADDSQGENEV